MDQHTISTLMVFTDTPQDIPDRWFCRQRAQAQQIVPAPGVFAVKVEVQTHVDDRTQFVVHSCKDHQTIVAERAQMVERLPVLDAQIEALQQQLIEALGERQRCRAGIALADQQTHLIDGLPIHACGPLIRSLDPERPRCAFWYHAANAQRDGWDEWMLQYSDRPGSLSDNRIFGPVPKRCAQMAGWAFVLTGKTPGSQS